MRGWRVDGVDLTERHDVLLRCRLSGATFVGCHFAPGDAALVRAAGGLVLPATPESPLDAARSTLYSPDELYDAASYPDTLDARAFAWTQRTRGREESLVSALHDHGIDGALQDWTTGRHLVGVMGGHAIQRGEPGYADAARLGHALGQHRVVATGGGPGAMEAANLGARLASRTGSEVDEALASLARVPTYRLSVGSWADAAFDVLEQFPSDCETLGIPTWHYGHEPPNVFASAIAKYVRNATREATLLEVCDSGIVFLPGRAGTVQEVFQDACENYYADESSVAPMVLVGTTYWTEELPAWPLLQSLARGRPMESHVHLVDTTDEAAELFVTDR